jgi:hypothetical protein
MAIGIGLLKQATIGVFPQLLARGNYRSNVSSGYFPIYRGAAALGTEHLTLTGMDSSYGYRADTGEIKLDGVNDYLTGSISINPSEMTLFCAVDDDGVGNGGDPSYLRLIGSLVSISVGRHALTDRSLITINGVTKDDYNAGAYGSYRSHFLSVSGGKAYERVEATSDWLEIDPSPVFNGTNYNATTLSIGAQAADQPLRFLLGAIKCVAIFPRQLTPEETTWLSAAALAGFPGLYANASGDTATLHLDDKISDTSSYRVGRYRRGLYRR